jgi:hypothetical protein
MMAAKCVSACVTQTAAPVAFFRATILPPDAPPGTKIDPCVPKMILSSVIAGVTRALSNGTPVMSESFTVHFTAPVALFTA